MSGTQSGTPVNVEPMRTAARRLLGPQAELPTYDDVHDLTVELRGHLMLLIPAVEQTAQPLPKDDVPKACAMVGVGEAQRRLDEKPPANLPAAIAHAQRLARSVQALCDHLENLRRGGRA